MGLSSVIEFRKKIVGMYQTFSEASNNVGFSLLGLKKLGDYMCVVLCFCLFIEIKVKCLKLL